MTNPETPSASQREAIARIIEPVPWLALDMGYDTDFHEGNRARSFVKADEILALTSNSGSDVAGGVREALVALEQACALIQEAKGFEGENGGPITDHLDFAEHWIGKAEAALTNPRVTPSKAGAGEEGCPPYSVPERAFHVVICNHGEAGETFVARDRATLTGIPAKDREGAYDLASSLNQVVAFHVAAAIRSAGPLPAQGGETGR